MSDEPFGRQPKSVSVTVVGDYEDAVYWVGELMRRVEFKGDFAVRLGDFAFKIHPRAVND